MKSKGFPFNYLFSPKLLVFNLFLIGILFQIYLIAQAKFFYDLIKILFFAEIILLIVAFIRLSIKRKVVILIVLFIVVLRLPFYFYPDGLITTSDNALEALQCKEIQERKTAPFFLLESIKHNGTIKYLFVSFIWDFFGPNYLYFALFQLMLFIALLFLMYEIFKESINRNALFLFVLVNFAFIEVFFNYSLSLRAGSYLEMLLLFFLGVYLFDFKFLNKTNIFLAYYFIFFSLYIHPLALLFAFSYSVCTVLFALKNRKVKANFACLLGGLFAGCFHLLYYIFFKAKPVVRGSWEALDFLSLSDLSPRLFVNLVHNFRIVFWNVFRFETSYLINFFDAGKIGHILSFLNKALIYFSLVIFILGFILVIRKLSRILLKKEKLLIKNWPYIFFLLLLVLFLAKHFLLSPYPPYEGRHNFDLIFLIIMSHLIVFSSFFKSKKMMKFKTITTLILLLLFTAPHYYYHLKMTRHKKSSYQEILGVLIKNRVRYLTTDFIIAYPIYFLSNRRILISDSLGPLTISNFYPEMRKKVDNIPRSRKTYLFFSMAYPAKEWHKISTTIIKKRILNYLKEENIKYKTYKLKDYFLIIPSQAKILDKRTSPKSIPRPS